MHYYIRYFYVLLAIRLQSMLHVDAQRNVWALNWQTPFVAPAADFSNLKLWIRHRRPSVQLVVVRTALA